MERLDTKELEQIISLYLDGELEPDEAKKFEEYLTAYPSVARDVEILRAVKKTLHAKEKLPANNWFWLRLSNSVESKTSHTSLRQLLSRPALTLTIAGVFIVLVSSVIYLKDAPLFHQFFLEKKTQVQSSLMSGNILPLFSNLNNDDVLNFALFGTIPLDSAHHTALQVKNSEKNGSQIEIVRKESGSVKPTVRVSDFCTEVGILKPQQEIIDSILGSYKERLLASVLVSENKEIAIHEQLVNLNRAMVSTIAASLEPLQRTKFQRFLEKREAPYALVAVNAPKMKPEILLSTIPKITRSNKYVVISKDTIGIAEMRMNIDSLRQNVLRRASHPHPVATKHMIQELAELERQFSNTVVVAGSNSHRVRVFTDNNAFKIDLEAPSPIVDGFELVDMVKPRMNTPTFLRGRQQSVTVMGDSGFAFEFPADDEALRIFRRLPQGEFRFEIIDSSERSPKMKILLKSAQNKKAFEEKLREMKKREQQLIDLDSLLRESEQSLNSGKPLPKKEERKVLDL